MTTSPAVNTCREAIPTHNELHIVEFTRKAGEVVATLRVVNVMQLCPKARATLGKDAIV
jgi:hypothetical protein